MAETHQRQEEADVYLDTEYEPMVRRAVAAGAVAEGVGYAEFEENRGVGSSFAYYWFDGKGQEVGHLSVMIQRGILWDSPKAWSEMAKGRLQYSRGFDPTNY